MQLHPIPHHPNRSDALYQSPDVQTLLDVYESYYPTSGFTPPWIGYFIVRDGTVVGSCAFTGQPVDGRVELAYMTFPVYERQGIASFACQALLAIAHETDPSISVIAKTSPEPNASTRILERNGFRYDGIVQDHEIGDAWLWVRTPNNRV
ncbi:GNAT family N-acetyltransferase [Spirosoma rhododendri]|uniref:GNAT family N-acetyltransferase n=1 Tax=Spirosoma rhododendri TaxID=2728024 RepID=A0A7L5DQ39_9BACT|nr:GNAT family N-acetyltransferase [Spirosoma rhododendri]QJD80516.1 GNAT family N-acetyltransferase [Spirosoma rhododendri]